MSTYLVTQATGQQSVAVITHLLAAGANVHAVVRDLQKVPETLKDPKITLFQGESKNFDEILRAAQGCKGAFLNTFPIPGLETQQAKTIAEACKKAGVESVVVSTAFSTHDRSMWEDLPDDQIHLREYYRSKAAVEDIVRQAGFNTYTILRPAFITNDFILPGVYYNFPELATHGELVHAYDQGARMLYTDVNDIGKYAAAAFLDTAKFNGQEIDLSSSLLTIEEVRDVLVKVTGKDIPVRKRTPAQVKEAEATVFSQKFHFLANVKDFSATKEAGDRVQAKFGIPFTPFEASLQRDKALLLECLPA